MNNTKKGAGKRSGDDEYRGLVAKTVIPVNIEDEVRISYLNYAMSVIVSRALPDVRDGLKPVHRRILYAMNEMGLMPGSAHKKTGRIVGDVLGKYHPHGDQSIYDALVRLAQDFSLRYPMIDGQGNFGSIDDDPPAAMRYTEARFAPVAESMLRDIKKDTVDFVDNYDESLKEPAVLPAALPFLLANGSSGIAVGMATSIPPHNLNEIAAAVDWYIKHTDCTSGDLCKHIRGPDFPTGGIIHGAKNIPAMYEKGRGAVCIRGRVALEQQKSGRQSIVVSELPYQVSKNGIIVRIAELVKSQRLMGIHDLRDESDKDGMRIVVEIKRDADSAILLNKLYQLTPLQTNINSNILALVHGVPKLLTLRDLIEHFVLHRHEVIVRRSKHDLHANQRREHILEGLILAIDNIDEVIRIIRASKNATIAGQNLVQRFSITETQVRAILEMRLQKLTNLETIKLEEELSGVRADINRLAELLASEIKIRAMITQETFEIADRFGDERRTEIVDDEAEILDQEDLVQAEQVVFMMSSSGYVKRTPVSSYRVQSRGGRGSAASSGTEHDLLNTIISGSTTDNVLFVSKIGKAYVLKLHKVPSSSRTAKGVHLRGLIAVGAEESVEQAIPVPSFTSSRSLILATRNGVVKRTKLDKFSNVRTRGIMAIKLSARDSLVSAEISDGSEDIFFFTRAGIGLRVVATSVRAMDRGARGVQGIRLVEGDQLVSAVTTRPTEDILLITAKGRAKRMRTTALQSHSRHTQGQRAFPISKKTGELVAALSVNLDDSLLIASSAGNASMIAVKGIPTQQRTAYGVNGITLADGEHIVAVERFPQIDKRLGEISIV